jgi:hypothetical protein
MAHAREANERSVPGPDASPAGPVSSAAGGAARLPLHLKPTDLGSLQGLLGNRATQAVLEAQRVQRMPRQHDLLDRPLAWGQLRNNGFTGEEVDQLWEGIGATTVRQVGVPLIVALRQRVGLLHMITVVQQLNLPELRVLGTLLAAHPQVFGTLVLRAAGELGALLAAPGGPRPLAEVCHLANLLPGLPAADVLQLATLPATLASHQIATIHADLGPPLTIANEHQLLQALAQGGLTGDQIEAVVHMLRVAGSNGTQIAALLNPNVLTRTHPEIFRVVTALRPLGVAPAQIVQLIGVPAAVGSGHLVQAYLEMSAQGVAQPIQPFYLAGLLRALASDGLNGAGVIALLQHLRQAGQSPTQIQAMLTRLRGNLQVPANPADPAARPITHVPALAVPPAAAPGAPPPLGGPVVAPQNPAAAQPIAVPAASQPGTKGLSGPEIAAHLTATFGAGRAATEIATHYPTGQDIGARTDEKLWDDLKVNAAGNYFLPHIGPGQVVIPGQVETPAERLIRQKLALAELRRRPGHDPATIQAIFSHDEGATPRPFVSLRNEDSYSARAHNTSLHVLGGTNMQNLNSLAFRVLGKVPNCDDKASAFNTLAEADAAVAGAIAARLIAQPIPWQTVRRQLSLGQPPAPIQHPSNAGVVLRKTDAPALAAQNPMPAPPFAPRPLIDPGAAIAANAAPPGGANPGYTHHLIVTHTLIVLRASDNQAGGGWCVYTTYPEAL